MGWLFRDLEDASLLAAPFASKHAPLAPQFTHFAFLADSFLHDCEPKVIECFRTVIRDSEKLGLTSHSIDPSWWTEAVEIFAAIQASEAAPIHAGNFEHFEPAIRDRLKWGAGLGPDEIATLRKRHATFRARMDELLQNTPCSCCHVPRWRGSRLAPTIARLAAGSYVTRRPSASLACPLSRSLACRVECS
jgi:aspartyl-tRNA(Asn)/glutamyl-tRNA(Gln) amidotransferase subunit A